MGSNNMAFPDVPIAPGVPPLARAAGVVFDVISLLTQDAVSIFDSLGPQQWGLFLDGVPVITADSVVSFGYKEEWRIPTYPIEGGSFESYNKVQMPFDVRMRFATGGSIAEKEAFLASVAAVIGSLDLFDAVTPEMVYQSVNPVHYDYNRTASNGVGLLVVDLWCEQVRVTASSQFTDSTKSPDAEPQVSGGTVQPVAATSSVLVRPTGSSQWQ